MFAQVAIQRKQPFGLHFNEHGVDKLHHIIASQLGQCPQKTKGKANFAPQPRSAFEVDVARIVFPKVAVRGHRNLMSQLSQPLGQGIVHVAVFA